jgi:hypothetical protein
MKLSAAMQLRLFSRPSGPDRAAGLFVSNCARFGRLNSLGVQPGVYETLTTKGSGGEVTAKTLKGFARVPVFDEAIGGLSCMAQAELEIKISLKPLVTMDWMSVTAEFTSRPVLDGISSLKTQEYIVKPFTFIFRYSDSHGNASDYLSVSDTSKIVARLYKMNDNVKDIVDLFNTTVSIAKRAAFDRLMTAYRTLEPELKIIASKYSA